MGFPQYTTPTFTLTFAEDELDLTQASDVYVSFRSGGRVITKSGDDLTIDTQSIGVYLGQNDTAQFGVGDVEIQANWLMNGRRVATEVKTYAVTEQLLRRVIG